MERAIHAVSSGAQQRALVLSSYRMDPHYVLLDFPGRRICHLITVLFRPAFRETVVGREPQAGIVDLTPSSHHKNTPIAAVQDHAPTGPGINHGASMSPPPETSPPPFRSRDSNRESRERLVSPPRRVLGFNFYLCRLALM